jgi:DNA sulfur modification protein DndC
LAEFRHRRDKRMLERRDGRIKLMGDGETTVAGPFTLEARQEVLARLLETQRLVDLPLIASDEIVAIKTIWAEDAVAEARRHLKNRKSGA